MTASARLRAFRPDDLAALADLWAASWKETGFAIDFDARRDWLIERLRALEAAGVDIVVAIDDEAAPVGFVTLDPANGHLDQLCVAPSCKGSGLAKTLLDAAKARGPGAVKLDVNEANARARRFYEREGFRVTARGVSLVSGLPILAMEWPAHLSSPAQRSDPDLETPR